MNFTFECPLCGQHISTTDDTRGLEANCPKCSGQLTVPTHTQETPATKLPQRRVGLRSILGTALATIFIVTIAGVIASQLGYFSHRNRSAPPDLAPSDVQPIQKGDPTAQAVPPLPTQTPAPDLAPSDVQPIQKEDPTAQAVPPLPTQTPAGGQDKVPPTWTPSFTFQKFDEPDYRPSDYCFDHTGARVAVCYVNEEGTGAIIRVWDTATGQAITTFDISEGVPPIPPNSFSSFGCELFFANDNRFIVVIFGRDQLFSRSGNASCWSISDGKQESATSSLIYCGGIDRRSNDVYGPMVPSGGLGSWNPISNTTKNAEYYFRTDKQVAINDVKFSPNGEYIFSRFNGHNVIVWERESGKVFYHGISLGESTPEWRFSPDSSYLLALFQPRLGAKALVVRPLPGSDENGGAIALHPPSPLEQFEAGQESDTMVFLTAETDGNNQVLITSWEHLKPLISLYKDDSPPSNRPARFQELKSMVPGLTYGLRLSPDGRLLLTRSKEGIFTLHDLSEYNAN